MRQKNVTLDLRRVRVLALTAEMRDVQSRLTALENRFSALETSVNGRLAALAVRFSVEEERMLRLIALVVRIAERVGATRE